MAVAPSPTPITPLLVEYVQRMGFTHVELMPVMQHPFGGSWGYHVTGYFAPTDRYGTPADFASMVDALHVAGIGVILDWVPAHFPDDEHGLADFDGQALFEYADPREGRHPEWGSRVFDFGRPEVRAFLVSSARWWIEKYHVDGLRVDAVASMLYRNYARNDGEWVPTCTAAVRTSRPSTSRQLTSEIHHSTPGDRHRRGVDRMAGSDRPDRGRRPRVRPQVGPRLDARHVGVPGARSGAQVVAPGRPHVPGHVLDVGAVRVLPLSHDEVVHGKSSLVGKMAGDDWQRRANLRLLFGHQFTVPGVPLVFMGGELAMNEEWSHERSLPWHLLDYPAHSGVQAWVAELNRLLRAHPALAVTSSDPGTFEWVDCDDRANSVVSWVRRSPSGEQLLVTANFTPTPHEGYRIGAPAPGTWHEIANSDDVRWEDRDSNPIATIPLIPVKSWHHSLVVTPPLAISVFATARDIARTTRSAVLRTFPT